MILCDPLKKSHSEAPWSLGKNKHLKKGGKRGAKKKVADPFSKKDWCEVKAPAMCNVGNTGKTQGTSPRLTGLKGCFGVSLADVQNDEAALRKLTLITEEGVLGKTA